jgi:hypothetical protein
VLSADFEVVDALPRDSFNRENGHPAALRAKRISLRELLRRDPPAPFDVERV